MKRFLNAPYRFALCWTAFMMTAFCWALTDTFVIAHRERISVELRQTISALTGTPAPQTTDGITATAASDRTDDVAATPNASASNTAGSTASNASTVLVTDTGYQDDAIRIDIQTFRYASTTCYAATVTLNGLSYLRTAFAEDTYGRNIRQPVREIAQAQQAILAINGDYYGSRNSGYVVRNGEVYRDRAASGGGDALLIDFEGSLSTTDETLSSAQLSSLWQAFSFGPTLVKDFQVCVAEGDEVSHAMLSNPRTAIGQIAPLQYVLFVSDGRTDESEGLSLYQLAGVMQELGCRTAYNLDGGGSSTMVFMGQVVNLPTTNGRRISERSVSDIVYIGY